MYVLLASVVVEKYAACRDDEMLKVEEDRMDGAKVDARDENSVDADRTDRSDCRPGDVGGEARGSVVVVEFVGDARPSCGTAGGITIAGRGGAAVPAPAPRCFVAPPPAVLPWKMRGRLR